MSFESNENEGTTFTFEVPKTPREQSIIQTKKPDAKKVYGL